MSKGDSLKRVQGSWHRKPKPTSKQSALGEYNFTDSVAQLGEQIQQPEGTAVPVEGQVEKAAGSNPAVVHQPPALPQQEGIALIQQEGRRQIESEHWTPAHDDEHIMGEMIGAAMTYAGHALGVVSNEEIGGADSIEYWPWDQEWWKPSPDAIRNLVKAGALIAAEIDRIQRSQK